MWGGQSQELAGYSEMHSKIGSFINGFCLSDVLAGPLEVHIRTLVAFTVPTIEEWVHKLCGATASIAFIKDTTSFGRLVATSSQIHTPPTATATL